MLTYFGFIKLSESMANYIMSVNSVRRLRLAYRADRSYRNATVPTLKKRVVPMTSMWIRLAKHTHVVKYSLLFEFNCTLVNPRQRTMSFIVHRNYGKLHVSGGAQIDFHTDDKMMRFLWIILDLLLTSAESVRRGLMWRKPQRQMIQHHI